MRLSLALIALSLTGALGAGAPPPTLVTDMVEKRTKLKTHSMYAPYVDSDLQNRWWDFGGDTIINTNKHVRLTQDKASQSGWLWSRLPLAVPNWQIEFEFHVDGKGMSMYGDGFALWVTRDRATPGPVFGNQDHFTGLAVFFDTYANSRHGYSFPRITAMLGDGRTPADLEGDNARNELAACSKNFRRRNVATKARLTYVKGKGLRLETQFDEWDKWDVCFDAPNVELPSSPFIGFTALTGDVADNHDIVGVSTYSATLYEKYRPAQNVGVGAPPMQKPLAQTRDHLSGGRAPVKTGGAAGWFLFILKLIGVAAFVAFAVAAYRTYSAQQSRRPAYY
ncbi:lectin [Cutaneotrichosporon oleaginosum]|uniref:Lectin n=1 Tax=Cutaneotrichosporon oleaginosum TaxID=879819 RepID=A0A0J0XML0_9TREE|nr:lectin [Cutaneotrichosporon oleaginosum]KLT42308.1 lectin [Cutaneotrichosporon oleaginosum]TXT11480.1 hypothetical protein COLE_01890 [Cutaneotrichosporon oleaginosum]